MVSDTNAPKLSDHFVDKAPSGCVIVISQPAGCLNAVWGGLMATRAQVLGVQGAVIDGQCRDVNEMNEMKFPVFARGTSSLGAGSFTRPTSVQRPITIKAESAMHRDVVVSPGDIIVSDMHGVVKFPADLLDQVVYRCAYNAQVDLHCMMALKQGHSIKETFAKYREK